jgi:UDP-glucose 4-epimerase
VFDRKNVDLRNLEAVRGDWDFLGGDFLNESDQRAALADATRIFHLISTTIPATSDRNPVYDVETNMVATVRLLDLAREAGVGRVVFLSSGGTVYGRPDRLPIDETQATEPLVSYGVVKLAIEKYLALYHRLHGISYRILRLSNPYGPRQDTAGAQGAASVFLERAFRGQPIEIWGDGSVVRDYIYVADAVEGVLAADEDDRETGVYNIGSGEGVSLNDLAKTIETIAGRKLEIRYEASRPFDVPANVLDVTRAREDLGWIPHTPLPEGLRLTWDWLGETRAR